MILICSEDREAYGQGHRSRMIALIDIFEALEIDFICVITNLQWQSELNKRNLKTIAISQTSGDENEANELIKKTEQYQNNIELFLCDGNRFENSYLSKIKKTYKKTVLIDDLGLPIRDQAEIVWNPNIYASSSLYKNWKKIKLFAGEKYVLLRKEFDLPVKSAKKQSIFVSLGISASDKIISIINQLAKEYKFSFILSDNFSVNDMIDAIDQSLLTICGASVTLHEVWRRNTIALPVYQAKDQIYFKQFLEDKEIDFVNILDENETQIKNNFIQLFNKYFNQEPFKNNNHVKMGSIKNNSNLIINELYSKKT